MSEAKAMVNALKRHLKSLKITYAQVARCLQLSEASVKRLFVSGNVTLDRLEKICSLAGLSLSDLAKIAEKRPNTITRLTEDQERLLVKDVKLLLVSLLTLNHWTKEEIGDTYAITHDEIVSKYLQLDRMGFIEFGPGERVRHLTAPHFAWRPDGPVQAYFEQKLRDDFMRTRFDKPGEHMRFFGGMIGRESMARVHAAIDKLVADMDGYIQADADLPREDRRGVAAVFAIRPWEIPDFRKLRTVAPPPWAKE